MKLPDSPTYIGWSEELGGWGFSANPMWGVDRLWNVSHWSWDNIAQFMNEYTQDERFLVLSLEAEEMEVKPHGA